MQLLTAPPRDGLTAGQVTQLLIGAPGVVYDRGCELLDSTLTVLEDITADFESGQVQRSMRSAIHGTCTVALARNVDYGIQLIRPYMTLTAAGVSARFNCGVFTLRKPTTTYGTSPVVNSCEGSDRLFLLNRPVGNSYVVGSGTGYIAAVRQVITDAGLPASTVLLDSSAAAKTLPADKLWPLLQDSSTTATLPPDATSDSSNATTWLQIVNELLAAIGYQGIWADQDGYFRAGPYADAAVRPAEFAFDYDDDAVTVVAPARSVSQDFSTTPNVWIFQQQNLVDGSGSSLEPTEGNGQYTVRNTSDGASSIDARNGLEFVAVVPLDAVDQAALVTQGNAQVASAKRVVKSMAVATAPFPAAGHWDVYTYIDAAVGGIQTVQETEWTLDMGSPSGPAADTTRTWEVVAP